VPAAEAFGAGVGPSAAKFQAGDHPGALMEALTLIGGDNPMARLTALPAEANEQAVADIATLFLGDLPALGGWTLTDDDARSITQPALTMLGTDSVVFFKECTAKLEELLPNAESCSLTGACHFLQIEKPAQAATALGAFLSRHPIKH
jgi:pimeloyl-ACP methyl ester carboxylesterase